MNGWFTMLGEPLSLAECAQVQHYLIGLGIGGDLPVRSTSSWTGAAQVISNPDWDQRWWDAEQRERERLRVLASRTRPDAELLRSFSQLLDHTADSIHGAAAIAASRSGCTETALVRAAAGALTQALYLRELAALAGENDHHPFALKHALFEGGHWPLGIVGGSYYVF